MIATKILGAFAVLALAAGPALAQTTAPAQGTVQPHHPIHPTAHKAKAKAAGVHPDQSADMLNARELSAIKSGAPAAAPAPTPAPAKK